MSEARDAGAETTAGPRTSTLPIASGRVVARHLWRALRGRRLRLCAVLLLFLVEAATALVFPLVIGALVDTVLTADAGLVPPDFGWQVTLLVLAALASGIAGWLAALLLARLAETVIAELRESYVSAALDLPRAEIEEAGTGDVVTRASDDIARISETLPKALPRVCVSAFTVVLVVAGLGSISWWYLTCFVLTVPLYALTVRWYLRTAPRVYAAERAAQSDRGQDVLGTITNLPTVQAHRLELRQLQRIRDSTWQTVRWSMRTRIVQNRLFGRLNITQAIGLLAILGSGIWLALEGQTTPGQATSAALLFLRTVAPIEALLFVMDELQSATASLARIIGITSWSRQTDKASTPLIATASSSEAAGHRRLVEFEGVSFGYPAGQAVLHGVHGQLLATRMLAIVGRTGSGKSTLASLLAGVHSPTEGRIVHHVPVERIMTVTQETHLFTGTVRDNLTLAAPAATEDELLAALARVEAMGIIDRLPGGLDTPVGAGGHTLTAAEIQHLALARLLLADPAVVVLDEATAEADSADADLLEKASRTALQDRASLVIAHRLSQTAHADHIVVLDRGRILEEGDHQSLTEADGAYARLYRTWAHSG